VSIARSTPALSDFPFKIVPIQERFPGLDDPLTYLPQSLSEWSLGNVLGLPRFLSLRGVFIP
jgi:hypothetical protein